MSETTGDRPNPPPARSTSSGIPPSYPAGGASGVPAQAQPPAYAHPPQFVAAPVKDTSGTNAVVGLVMGIIALLLSWIPVIGIVSWVIGGLGLLFSILGFRQRNASQAMSLVGIVLNGLALAICGIYLVWFVALFSS